MKTFIPGQIASAADVNANFAELLDKIRALENLLGTPADLQISPNTGWKLTVVEATRTGRRIDCLLKLQRTAGAFTLSSGGFYRVGTIGAANLRPKFRSFGHMMSAADLYLYADPNGNIDLMSWKTGSFGTGEWDVVLSWTIA
ncbi:hypothetical protein [Schaalia hyovaginalis]|uniref:hypothetical protein n=1 Tax=Schaalia hyovaginalis TaxID=29316 RepID=UPI002A8151F1|nr:hypothetical protein [Schaalia hyovaginalis]MDY4491908.1 hypothetical protein [Schaalia hyovaginalis]